MRRAMFAVVLAIGPLGFAPQPAKKDLPKPLPDASMKELGNLKTLTKLILFDVPVTDAGLKELARLENLTVLFLAFTKTTKDGVAELQIALPKCRITHR